MASVTWLGDEDPSVQVISQYGITFVKGEPVKVDDASPFMSKFRNAAVFSVDEKDPAIVDSKEPEPVDPEEGTERDAVKKALDERGLKYDGRAKLETLRAQLAKATAE